MKYVRTTTKEDVFFVAARLRAADVMELQAGCGLAPLEALTLGLERSATCFTLLMPDNETPFGIAGVIQHPQAVDVGIVWMLATPDIESVRFHFLRRAREVVDALNSEWSTLTNAVDARNTVHIHWLEWLGFRFINILPDHGVEKRPFIEFVRNPCAIQSSARH